jgi:hypothetical protein
MVWDADHIISRYVAEQMGMDVSQIDTPSNIGVAHRSCNNKAGAKLSASIKQELKAEPRQVEKVARPKPKLNFEKVFSVDFDRNLPLGSTVSLPVWLSSSPGATEC